MATYSVLGADGQSYGPVDEATLGNWAREGRINAQTSLQCTETGQQLTPQHIPAIAPLVGLSPQMVQTLSQPAIPTLAHSGVGSVAPSIQTLPYSSGYTPIAGNQLTSLNPGVLILLHFVTFGIFTLIHFGLMHNRMPRNRPDDPSAGKAIGFMFIPFFNLYWIFFANLRLIDRVNEQRQLAGMPPGGQRNLFIWAMVLIFCSIIPLLNLLTAPTAIILMLVYYGTLQSSVNELVLRTRGPGF